MTDNYLDLLVKVYNSRDRHALNLRKKNFWFYNFFILLLRENMQKANTKLYS